MLLLVFSTYSFHFWQLLRELRDSEGVEFVMSQLFRLKVCTADMSRLQISPQRRHVRNIRDVDS
jgi:hypothetical protein